jgi:hypothetical protein
VPFRDVYVLLGSPLRPGEDKRITSQGHPHAIFRRAIDAGNIVAAELAARELRGLSLADALDFTALVPLRDLGRSRRTATRWLQRWLDKTPGVTIDEAAMVAGCLAALGRAQRALAALRATAKRATSREPSARIP